MYKLTIESVQHRLFRPRLRVFSSGTSWNKAAELLTDPSKQGLRPFYPLPLAFVWCPLCPTLVLLPGNSHGQRSLVVCSPWGCEESDTTERLPFHFSLSCIGEGNGNPLQCSCLENPRDGGAWEAAVYGVTQSRTWLKWLSSCCSAGKWPPCRRVSEKKAVGSWTVTSLCCMVTIAFYLMTNANDTSPSLIYTNISVIRQWNGWADWKTIVSSWIFTFMIFPFKD